LQIAVTIYAVGIGEQTRLACDCPASSPNRFCNEAADIAAVVFAMMAGASASFICVWQLALVPGADAGHHTRDGCAPPCHALTILINDPELSPLTAHFLK
jgi:hypothetical protein